MVELDQKSLNYLHQLLEKHKNLLMDCLIDGMNYNPENNLM